MHSLHSGLSHAVPCRGAVPLPAGAPIFPGHTQDRLTSSFGFKQLAGAYARRHVLRLLAVDATVLELDRRVLALARETLQLVPLGFAPSPRKEREVVS